MTFSSRFAFLFCLLFHPLWAAAQAITLQNPAWQVELDPDNLAIRVTPAGSPPLQVSSGVASRLSSELQQDGTQASWRWADAHTALTARLAGSDLELSLQATQATTLPLLRQPASALGRALILPRGEGRRIPADHTGWRDFLLNQGNDLNSSEDLSLPLWTLEHPQYTLTWLLLNPYNNQLHFYADGNSFGLSLSHGFTPQNLAQPMLLRLHLEPGTDWLAGAKNYRNYLIKSGNFTSMERKIQQLADNAKLLGASHVYLWGNGPISPADVRNPSELLRLLKADSPLAKRLRARFDPEEKQVLRNAASPPDGYQLKILVRAINQAMAAEARSTWQVAQPDWSSLGSTYQGLMQQLQQTFSSALGADRQRWGGGLSLQTIQTLQNSGLPRLWLGVDNWEGGLWHPQAVRAGVRAGYLMAAYDSYETSLAPGQRPDWTSAQLGSSTHQRCGIVRSNGTMQAGFQQSGYYTNPLCVQETLRARTSALLAATGFNSWFLDVYGAGMLFDDYRRGQTMSQQQMAASFSDNMDWVANKQRIPVGSENGNALTTRGLVFAHGMQVPVIGWGDAEMSRVLGSPYFVGRWYPSEQPELFFRPVPLKPVYLLTTFDPRYRIPLYQAVFHDSVISSNHWLNDNFKFSNADSDNRLAQMLYNVAPLYHLSAATLQQRLPLIRCTDRFFRPLHQQLATRALSGFSWLSPDGLVQQTRFSDGSSLTANFDARERQEQGYRLAAHSVRAALANGTQAVYSSDDCR
jgi:hypothetical protein